MGMTRHEILRIRESRDHPADRAIDPACQAHAGKARHPQGHILPLWTALPLQVDFEKDPLWFVANIYPASPDGIGVPKWARARLYSWRGKRLAAKIVPMPFVPH